jgi:TPR repeat protein
MDARDLTKVSTLDPMDLRSELFRQAIMGSPEAQVRLGDEYLSRVLPHADPYFQELKEPYQSFVIEAARWYRMAAEQGHGAGQYILGLMCSHGIGVAQNNMEAYVWLSLAAARSRDDDSHEKHANARALVAQGMTSEEIAEAKRGAREAQRRILDLQANI